jgi:hypothetical protein
MELLLFLAREHLILLWMIYMPFDDDDAFISTLSFYIFAAYVQAPATLRFVQLYSVCLVSPIFSLWLPTFCLPSAERAATV